MNLKNFFEVLELTIPSSAGLQSYLSVALVSLEIRKNAALDSNFHIDYPFSFIEEGNLKTQIDGKINPGQYSIRFHFKGEFLPTFIYQDDEDYQLRTTALEHSILIALPARHIQNLYRLFPSFLELMLLIKGTENSISLHEDFKYHHMDSSSRLEALMKKKPDIFQIASVHDIAGNLGIHPHTLSSIRGQKGI